MTTRMRRLSRANGSAIAIALVILGTTLCRASDQPGMVCGIVRDDHGKPVEGVRVTITGDQTPPTTAQTISNEEGEYRFIDRPPGNYHVTVRLPGFVANTSNFVHLSSASSPAKLDFTLTPQPANAEREIVAPGPPLKFQAAGIRGLIDAGGYSAPANAAAASVLVAGMADIQRSGNDLGVSAAASAKDWPCALEPELKNAISANPEKTAPIRRLAEFYLAHDQAAKAIPLLESARRIEGAGAGHDEISRDLAIAWMKTQQFDTARQILTAKSAGQSNNPGFHVLLARADEGSGLFGQAAEEYRIAASADPSEENLFGVGYESLLAGELADAARAFQSGVQRYPHSTMLLMGAGAADFLQGHASDSIVWLLRATDVDPKDPRPYPLLSSASTASPADIERVRISFKRFLELAPGSAQANYFYAVNLLTGTSVSGEEHKKDLGADRDFENAQALLKNAIQLDPNFAKAHFQLGIVYARRGENENAINEYETTVRLAPELREAHYRLAGAYRRAGRQDEAVREMRLFQEMRDRAVAKTNDNNVEQFVTVIHQPRSQAVSSEAQCPNLDP